MTIDLSKVDEHWYLAEICRALTTWGYHAVVKRIREGDAEHKPPRDLAEVFVLLPDDVAIKLGEVPDGQAAPCSN